MDTWSFGDRVGFVFFYFASFLKDKTEGITRCLIKMVSIINNTPQIPGGTDKPPSPGEMRVITEDAAATRHADGG